MKIMVAGKKGAGKDEAVKYLLAKYGGLDFSFAKPLYDMMYACQDIMGIPRYKDRLFLTTIGDHYRKDNPNAFVDRCFTLTNLCLVSTYITDGRYENELDNGKKNGFSIIQVVSDDNIRQTRRPNESIIDSHSSENGYPDDYPFDITIVNNGTLEEFHAELNKFVQPLLKE